MTFDQLLVVQAHDSAVDRLTYSRANLPEFQALEQLDDEQAHLDAERAAVADQRHELEREQKRLEDEAALVADRMTRENGRLYDGSVTAHKDLQAIQDEIATLTKRRDEFDDLALEIMEKAEPLDASLEDFDAKLQSVAERRTQVEASLESSQRAIDDEIAGEQTARTEAIAQVEPSLVSEYETSRADCGGVGICKLVDKTCQGCHLSLPAVEYDRVRKEPADALVRCAECTRILVR